MQSVYLARFTDCFLMSPITLRICTRSLICVLYVSFCTIVFAQNLIPDSGFEEMKSSECQRPDVAFQKMSKWYLLDATPDLFVANCDFDEQEFVYWNEDTVPYEGNNYVGLWSRWNSNNNYFSEGIAIRLSESVEVGQVYELQLAVKNRGSFQALEDMARCILQPNKHLDLYLSTDSIAVINDFSTGTASTSADLISSFDSEVMTGRESDEWELVSICFQAAKAYQYLALIMPLGTFGELPECATSLSSSGLFRSFYYNIDQVTLRPLHLNTSRTIEVCTGRSNELNIKEIFNDPLLSDASFTWPDGSSDFRNQIPEGASSSLVYADIGCAQVSLQLDIKAKDCGVKIYVPNVFHPMSASQNANFKVLFSDDLAFSLYDFRIYDRWGNLVFASTNPLEAWDGYKDRELLAPGIYSWILKYINDKSETQHVEHAMGDVTVMH